VPTECNPNRFEFARVEGRAALAGLNNLLTLITIPKR